MQIVVLMAGDGTRFMKEGYTVPKPLIKVKGKTILEWTTHSLPFIEHYGKSEVRHPYEITFAIRSEHNSNCYLEKKLKKIYGANTKIKIFNKLTRGNLETAHLTVTDIINNKKFKEELLILDADNYYDGSNFLKFKSDISVQNFGIICYFRPIDDNPKWCFAKLRSNKTVESFHEKEIVEGGMPMMGVFFYSNHDLFLGAGRDILFNEQKTKGEFYMSQTLQYMLEKEYPIYGYEAPKVAPLGTPEDVKNFLGEEK